MRVFAALVIGFLLPCFGIFAQTPDANSMGAVGAMQNYRLGRDLESRNRMGEATAYYNEAIRICQDEVARNAATGETYTVITWALRRQNRHADVITWGERGLRQYAGEYRIVETMGEAYFYMGDYNRSLLFMQRYANAVPQGERTPVAYFFIGEIFRLTERFRHADIAYTTALRLDPGSALWWFRLATVRESAGDTGPAMEAYQRALNLNPNYREATEGLARLRTR